MNYVQDRIHFRNGIISPNKFYWNEWEVILLMFSHCILNLLSGGLGKGGDRGEEPGSLLGGQQQSMHGAGHCKWFNVRMGFGFISMTSRGGTPVDPPMDVFVHQVS